MARRRKKLVTATERILLFLADFKSYAGEMEGPMELTQIGISEAIGIARGNVTRAIRPLLARNLVETHKVHIPGIRLKRNIYYLAPPGMSRAKTLLERLSKVSVEISDAGGKREARLGNVAEELDMDVRFIDVVREVNDTGLFDREMYLGRKRRAEAPSCAKARKVTELRYFVGREKELDAIRDWLGSGTACTMIISGMPGIGKSTLISRAVAELPSESNFYFKINTWCSVRSFLRSVSEFLSENGKGELRSYLDSNNQIDMFQVEFILSDALSGTRAVLIFDDYHNAAAPVAALFPMLHNLVSELDGPKLLVSGRSIEPFCDRRDVIVRKRVVEMSLEGLDPASTRELARILHISEPLSRKMHSITDGHPLFVELMGHGERSARNSDIERFILEEFATHLEGDELELMKYLSVHRYPLPRGGMRSFQPALARLSEQHLLKGTGDHQYFLQDMVKDAIYNSLSEKELGRYHAKAAEYYLEFQAVDSKLEALHHLLNAGKPEAALNILLEREDGFLNSGKMEELARILSVLLSREVIQQEPRRGRPVFMLATALSFLGEWDDALEHFRNSMELARSSGDELLEMKSRLGIAVIDLNRNEYEASMASLEDILSWALKHKNPGIGAETHYHLGSINEKQGRMDLALEHFLESRKKAMKLRMKSQLAQAIYGLGRVYHKRHEYAKALESKVEAVELANRAGDEQTATKIWTSIAWTMNELGRPEEALEANDRAIELARKNGAVRLLAYTLSNAGAAYIDRNDLARAASYLGEASGIFAKLGEARMLATVQSNMAMVEALGGRGEAAERLIEASARVFTQLKDSGRLMTVYFNYGQVMAGLGKSKDAARYLELALGLSRELGDKKSSGQIGKALRKIRK